MAHSTLQAFYTPLVILYRFGVQDSLWRTHTSGPSDHINLKPTCPSLPLQTATNQFSHLNRIQAQYLLKPRRLSSPLNVHFSFIVTLLVVMSGDIQVNPGLP